MNQDKKILQAIAEHLGVSGDDIDREASLEQDLGLGPVEISDLLNYLAQKFDLSFSQEEMDNLQSVEDLIVLVEDNLIE